MQHHNQPYASQYSHYDPSRLPQSSRLESPPLMTGNPQSNYAETTTSNTVNTPPMPRSWSPMHAPASGSAATSHPARQSSTNSDSSHTSAAYIPPSSAGFMGYTRTGSASPAYIAASSSSAAAGPSYYSGGSMSHPNTGTASTFDIANLSPAPRTSSGMQGSSYLQMQQQMPQQSPYMAQDHRPSSSSSYAGYTASPDPLSQQQQQHAYSPYRAGSHDPQSMSRPVSAAGSMDYLSQQQQQMPSGMQYQQNVPNSAPLTGASLNAMQQQQQQRISSPFSGYGPAPPGSAGLRSHSGSPPVQAQRYQNAFASPTRPPISVLTAASPPSGSSSYDQSLYNQNAMGSSAEPGSLAYLTSESSTLESMFNFAAGSGAGLSNSSSTFALGLGVGLDPTSVVYDENSRGYATPSYAGSFADDSSFDDRENDFASVYNNLNNYNTDGAHSQQGYSKATTPESRNDVLVGADKDASSSLNPQSAFAGADLLAFRESVKQQREWDDVSSASGYAHSHVSGAPSGQGAGGALNSSPELRGGEAPLESGNGLEMAVEMMFAPIPSPMPIPVSREQTIRTSSASPPLAENQHRSLGNAARQMAFTASPHASPRLHADGRTPGISEPELGSIPQLARSSPSPSPRAPAFRVETALDSPSRHPTLKSPPLPHGINQKEARTNSLAQLAIPSAPDLMLTTATPTAVPRTATGRQDSTMAALDSVFTFFNKPQTSEERKDSTDLPASRLPDLDLDIVTPIARRPNQGLPLGDLTLDLQGPSPYRRRQRSKSDTYMTSPIVLEAGQLTNQEPYDFPLSSAGLPTGQQAEGQRPSSRNRDARPRTDTIDSLPAIDPRALDGSTSNSDEMFLSRLTLSLAPQDNGLPTGLSDYQLGEEQRQSLVGPAGTDRRRSAAGGTPYDMPTANMRSGNISVTPSPNAGQTSFLIPPTPADMRRSQSAAEGRSHRRGAVSEDFTSSTFSPRNPEFDLSIDGPRDQQYNDFNNAAFANIPMMPPPMSEFAQPDANQFDLSNSSSSLLGMDGNLFSSMPGLPTSQYPSQLNFGYPQTVHGSNMYSMPQTAEIMPGYSGYGGPMPTGQFNAFDPTGLNPLMMQHQFGPDGMPRYASLEEDMAGWPDGQLGMPVHARRRRSSAVSDVSGYSGLSHQGEVSLESKTTEATKQAARRRRKDPNSAKFACEYCGETFTRAYNLKGHIRSHEGSKPFVCEVCNKGFARRHDLKRHELLHTGVKKYQCEACGQMFVRLDALQRHHKSENGAACVAQIETMLQNKGVEL